MDFFFFNASGEKRLISVNRPVKVPKHSVLSTGATEWDVFRYSIEHPSSFIYLQYLKIGHLVISRFNSFERSKEIDLF